MRYPNEIWAVLSTSSSNEDYDGDCDLCVIRLTPDVLKDLVAKMNRARSAQEEDSDFYCARYWWGDQYYVPYNAIDEDTSDLDGEPIHESTQGGYALVKALPPIANDDYQRMEAGTLQVKANEVWWSAWVKHCNVNVATTHMSRAEIEEIYERMEMG